MAFEDIAQALRSRLGQPQTSVPGGATPATPAPDQIGRGLYGQGQQGNSSFGLNGGMGGRFQQWMTAHPQMGDVFGTMGEWMGGRGGGNQTAPAVPPTTPPAAGGSGQPISGFPQQLQDLLSRRWGASAGSGGAAMPTNFGDWRTQVRDWRQAQPQGGANRGWGRLFGMGRRT